MSVFLCQRVTMQATTSAGVNQHRFTEICKSNSVHQLMTNASFAEDVVVYQHLLYLHSPGRYLLTETQEIYDFCVLLKISDNPVLVTGTICSCQADELHQNCWRRVRRLAEGDFPTSQVLLWSWPKLAQKLWSSESCFIRKEVQIRHYCSFLPTPMPFM